MNMNKALQHLYKAVSGNDTSKVNISKLLVDIHYAATGVECAVKNNWSKIIDSIATNWTGGGGSSDFTTATVSLLWTTSDYDASYSNMPTALDEDHAYADEGAGAYCWGVYWGDEEAISNTAILYKGQCILDFGDKVPKSNIAITGSATLINFIVDNTKAIGVKITGDCTITIS